MQEIIGNTKKYRRTRMANYTILGKKEIENLIAQYAVGDIVDFSVIEGGAGNSSLKIITNQGNFILTICDEKTYHEVKNLADLLDHLEQQNFPITRIVQTKNREPITYYKKVPVILKKFIEGEVFNEIDLNMLFQLGKTVAKLHEIPVPEYLPQKFPYGIDFFLDVISTQVNLEFSNWLKEKYELITEKISPELPRGLIHGDIFYDNVLFTPDKKLAAIIDFEEACYYHKIFDLGMCIIGTCSPKGTISFAKAKSFIDGYQSKRELEALEKESVKVFAEYAAVATSFWRFRQHHITKPDKNKANSFRVMRLLADNIHSISEDEFAEKLF